MDTHLLLSAPQCPPQVSMRKFHLSIEIRRHMVHNTDWQVPNSNGSQAVITRGLSSSRHKEAMCAVYVTHPTEGQNCLLPMATNHMRLWQGINSSGRDPILLWKPGLLCHTLDTANWMAGCRCLYKRRQSERGLAAALTVLSAASYPDNPQWTQHEEMWCPHLEYKINVSISCTVEREES